MSAGWTRAATLAAFAWTLGVTVARAVRWPNDFAEAHWLLDYRFGFVKRGLVGELLTLALAPFGAVPTERLVDGLSMALFVALLLVLFWLAVRLARADGWSGLSVLAALALLSSPFVVMSAHLVGYFDHLLFLLTAAAIVLAARGRPWSGAAVQAIAVFVHESAIVYGVPVFAFACLHARARAGRAGPVLTAAGRGRAARDGGGRSRPALSAAAVRLLPVLAPVSAFLLIAIAGRYWQAPDFQDRFSAHLAAFPFVGGDMHVFVPEWLAPSFFDQYAEQARRFPSRIVFAEAWGLVLPTTLALFTCGAAGLRRRNPAASLAVPAVAILLPEALHLAAWDTIRIWTYTIGAAALVALAVTVAETAGDSVSSADGSVHAGGDALPVAAADRDAAADAALRWVALTAIAVNVLAMTPLLDDQVDRLDLTTRLALYTPTLAAAVLAYRRG